MAVMMVTGNSPVFPEPIWNIFSVITTITGTLAGEMPEVVVGSVHYSSLFALALVLMVIRFKTAGAPTPPLPKPGKEAVPAARIGGEPERSGDGPADPAQTQPDDPAQEKDSGEEDSHGGAV